MPVTFFSLSQLWVLSNFIDLYMNNYWTMHYDNNIENNVIDIICMILYKDLTLIRCYLGICKIGGRYVTISNSMGLFSKHFFMGGLFQSHIIK